LEIGIFEASKTQNFHTGATGRRLSPIAMRRVYEPTPETTDPLLSRAPGFVGRRLGLEVLTLGKVRKSESGDGDGSFWDPIPSRGGEGAGRRESARCWAAICMRTSCAFSQEPRRISATEVFSLAARMHPGGISLCTKIGFSVHGEGLGFRVQGLLCPGNEGLSSEVSRGCRHQMSNLLAEGSLCRNGSLDHSLLGLRVEEAGP
jgi:hypothetical protein